jgi:hypothetical protein
LRLPEGSSFLFSPLRNATTDHDNPPKLRVPGRHAFESSTYIGLIFKAGALDRGTHIPMASDLLKMCVNMTNEIDKAGINGRQSLCIPRPAIAKEGTQLYMSNVSKSF